MDFDSVDQIKSEKLSVKSPATDGRSGGKQAHAAAAGEFEPKERSRQPIRRSRFPVLCSLSPCTRCIIEYGIPAVLSKKKNQLFSFIVYLIRNFVPLSPKIRPSSRKAPQILSHQ